MGGACWGVDGGVGVTQFTDGVMGDAMGVPCWEGEAEERGGAWATGDGCTVGTCRDVGTGICMFGTGIG